MQDNELNALDITGEDAPVVTTEPVVETAVETASAEIDQTPDPEALKAETAKLNKKKEEAKASTAAWKV